MGYDFTSILEMSYLPWGAEIPKAAPQGAIFFEISTLTQPDFTPTPRTVGTATGYSSHMQFTAAVSSVDRPLAQCTET